MRGYVNDSQLHYWIIFTLMITLFMSACVEDDGDDLARDAIGSSIIATWDPSTSDTFNDATVGNGTLEFSINCVRLILENQKTILLVWPEPTSWNAESEVIEYVSVQGERMELRDGDQVIPGGSTAFGSPQYVLPPDPACEAEEIFIVASLRIVTE